MAIVERRHRLTQLSRLEAGVSVDDIAESFATSPEALATYPYLAFPNLANAEDLVNQVYQNVLGRDADAEGLAYYVGQLEDGERSVGEIVASIVRNAATNEGSPDQQVLANKVEVALDFANKAAATPGFRYEGAAVEQANTVLDNVNQTEASVEAAKADNDAFFEGGTVGDTFTLTTDVDNLVGTDGNDTFQGIVASSTFTGNTVNTFDAIDGGAGIDTLDLVVRSSTIASNLDIKNIEIVNLLQGAATLSTVDVNTFGYAAQQIWQVDGAASVVNLDEGQTAGFRNTGGQSITVAAGATSAAIALDNVASGSTFTIVDSTTLDNALDTVSVSGSIAASGTDPRVLTLEIEGAGGANGITDINLALTTNTTINVGNGFSNVESIDASESTGGITASFAGASSILDLQSVIGGSGNDNIRAGLARLDGEVSIDTGAGNDTIRVELGVDGDDDTSAELSLTGGAGNDTFVFAGGNISADDTATGGFANTVTITDFGTGDLLNIERFDGFSAQVAVDTVVENLAEGATLWQAVNAVANLLATGGTNITDSAQFVFEGNTYVYVDDAAIGFTSGDTLIELTGVVTLNNTNVIDTVSII